jgi:hypothetical protein
MRFLALLAILFGAAAAHAQVLVLNGLPSSKVESSSAETKREVLPQSKQLESRVLITKEGGNYFWASRGNRPLVYRSSGVVHVFVEAGGAGYIEVIDQNALPEPMRAKDAPRILYKEHIRSMLTTITYWGGSDAFAP